MEIPSIFSTLIFSKWFCCIKLDFLCLYKRIKFLINQCQIITFIILKFDIIENSRIELRGIVLPVPSNQIKVTFIIILPFDLVHL